MDNAYLKKIAKDALAGRWGIAATGSLIYFCIYSVCQLPSLISNIYEAMIMFDYAAPYFISSIYTFPVFAFISSIMSLVVMFALPVLAFGFYSMGYKAVNGYKIETSTIFDGFRNFGNVFILYLLTTLYTVLWSMLFIIPGIVKAISYSMANFIMAENPDIKPSDAINESKKLMEGRKLDYFLFSWSFIGWYLLNLLTLGVLTLWTMPYINTACAAFYETVKREKYGDYAPYVYKNMLYKQLEAGYYVDPQQFGAPYGQSPYGYAPNQQNGAPYGQSPYGYAPNQQNGAPYGQSPYGYAPNQQNGAPYVNPNPAGYTDVNAYSPEQNGNNYNM